MFWFEQADPETLFASAITMGELILGIEFCPQANAATIWSHG
jgi:hypothetical protein